MMWRLPSLLLSASSASHHFSDLSLSRARGAPFHIGVLLFSAPIPLASTLRVFSRRVFFFSSIARRPCLVLSALCAARWLLTPLFTTSSSLHVRRRGAERRPSCCSYQCTAPSRRQPESAEERECYQRTIAAAARSNALMLVSAVEVRAANSVELAESDARLA